MKSRYESMGLVRVVIVFSGVLLVGCSPVGSSYSEKLEQSSLGYGCDSSVSQKVSLPTLPPVIQKWNFKIQNESGVGVSAKAENSLVPMGQKVMLALDNQCAAAKKMSAGLKQLLAAVNINKIHQSGSMQRSYHSFHLDRDYRYSELRSIISEDPCVITFEEQKFFKTAAFPGDPLVSRQSFWSPLGFPQSFDGYFSVINSSVVVAVIDSGMDLDHEDLAANIWTNSGEIPGNGIDDDNNGYVDDVHGYHFQADMGDPDPSSQFSVYNLHGTAVAGLIGASGNNIGIVGVMPMHIELMSLNVFGESASSDVSDVAEAIDYAVANGAQVINMSLAGRSSSTVIQTALLNAAAAGVVVVLAAGNDGAEISASNFYAPVGYAKDIDGVIAVGATVADTRRLAPYSNRNPEYVEIAAPGSSTLGGSPTGVYSLDVDDGYGHYDGTSFSAPLVAGAAALSVAYLQSRGVSFTAGDIEALLKNSSDQFQALSGSIQQCRSLSFSRLLESLSDQN